MNKQALIAERRTIADYDCAENDAGKGKSKPVKLIFNEREHSTIERATKKVNKAYM